VKTSTRNPAEAPRFKPSLRLRYLLIFVLLAVVPISIAVTVVLGGATERMLERAEADARASLDLLVGAVSDDVEASGRNLRVLAQSPSAAGLVRARDAGGMDPVDASTAEQWRQRLERTFQAHVANHDAIRSLAFIDDTGQDQLRVARGESVAQAAGPDAEASRALEQSQRGIYVSDVVRFRVEGGAAASSRSGVWIYAPVRVDGQVRGVLRLEVELQSMKALQTGGREFVLTSSGGQVLQSSSGAAPPGVTLGLVWRGLDPVRAVSGQTVRRNGSTFLAKSFDVNEGDPPRVWMAVLRVDTGEMTAAADMLNGQLLILAGVVAVVAALMALFVAGRVTRPMVALVDAVHRIQAGDTSVRVETRWFGEMREVAQSFNGMLDALDRNRTELIAAKDAAESTTRTKSEFLANMSHEIRTPMNGVLGMLELLEQSDLQAAERGFVRTARTSAEALLALLNDILDFSKIEAGKLRLETIDFDVRELVEEVGALLAKQAHAKGIEVVCIVPPDLPRSVRGDPSRLRQVLVNLVGNAIKFTNRGEVVLSVRPGAPADGMASLSFEVRDTGIGMSTETLLRLFRPFMQADSSTTRKYGGTGLGLAISHQLVSMMGGELTAMSEQGHGSTFGFQLLLPLGDGTQHSMQADTVLTGLRVLLADDNATNRLIVEHHLAAWGIHFAAAGDGQTAWEMIQAEAARGRRFDLLLLDHHMPGLDGMQLSRMMAQDPQVSAVPRILLSSSGRLTREEGAGSGLTASLAKPLRARQLYEAIAVASGRHSTQTPAARTPAATAAARTGRLLLVEDNLVNQKVALVNLKKLGFDVQVAGNGREALIALAGNRFDLILMDCQMPEMDGFEATRAIRQREEQSAAKRIPIVALTANALEGDREQCISVGMDDYLTKPFKQEQLREVLDRWLPVAA
jgi:signal transduction histidine kinase/DNA-binding response OmpR family regulator